LAEGSDPVRLSFKEQTLIIRHGMLTSENDHIGVIETLSDINWAVNGSATRPLRCAFIDWQKLLMKPN